MTRRPNIVLILADDLGWRDLGCYGSTFYETPRLDALAAQGALFTDAYAAAPVCSPTRASLLTGRYPARVGVTQYIGGHAVGRLADVPYHQFLPVDELTLARALRAGGYQTWHVGKWHLGTRRTWPERHGFDVNIAGCDWGHPRSWFSPYGIPTLADGPEGEYLTDRLTDEAISLVESAGERPFYLNLWHYAVHVPTHAPPELVARYRAKAEATGLAEIDPFAPGEAMPAWHQDGAQVRRRTVQSDPDYAAMVENLDTNVGRLPDAIARTGHAENTVVVFTSDNGGLSTAEGSPTSNLPLSEGKGWTEEGGIREPLVIRWPGVVTPGARISEPVTSPDFYPTLLAAADLPAMPGQHVDGVDFGPALRGETFRRGPIFWHYPHYSNQGGRPSAAVRDGRWKLIRQFEGDTLQLYDIVADPGEHADLATVRPDVTTRLSGLLARWLGEVGAQLPAPNRYREPFAGPSRTARGGAPAARP